MGLASPSLSPVAATPDMFDLWTDLAPLVLASAALPVQIVITLALVRSSLRSATAWVGGMTVVRLAQGVLFGVVFTRTEAEAGPDSTRFVVAGVQLVLALALYVKALRTAVSAEDEDAPPPQWVTRAAAMSPLRAFSAGAGFMTLSAKFLIFTLGAIGLICEAHLGPRLSILNFLLFVGLAHSVPLALLALGMSSSSRSKAILDNLSAWLKRNSRVITILAGVIF